jgi:hypothetical protein
MNRCSRCVIPGDWPGIKFDDAGVCSLCHGYERRWRHWRDPKRRVAAARQLEQLLQRARRRARGAYDALVPFTGGKDSTRVLHLLTHVHGLRVLAYTYDNGLFTDAALANIRVVTTALGVEHEFERFDGQLDLVRHFLAKTGNLCGACVVPHLTGCHRIAHRRGIPLIAFGLARRTDANLPDGMNPFYFANVVRDGFGPERLAPIWSGRPLLKYALDTLVGRTTVVSVPDHLPWEDERDFDEIAALYGISFPREHFDCLGSETAEWLARRRYGFSYPTVKASQLVRAGRLSREQALQHVAEREVDVLPASAGELLARLGLGPDDLEACSRLSASRYCRGVGNALAIRARDLFFGR